MPSTCPTENVHVGAVGTVFRVTVKENGVAKDLTGVTDIDFKFKKPDKTYLDVTGVLEDATDGIVSYTSVADDLDMPGRWHFEVTVVLPTWQTTTDAMTFWVEPNL